MTDNINNTLENITNLQDIDELSQQVEQHLSAYIKSKPSTRLGRSIPPLDKWHPEQVSDMDLTIKANGEWWHEGGQITRESLVRLFATILWKEDNNGATEYFLKTPVQKLRIQVEDVPLLINDVGIVKEAAKNADKAALSWLEFTTTTGDVVRLDEDHPLILRSYNSHATANSHTQTSATTHNKSDAASLVRPYMLVRDGLMALIGRNTFYHLTEIGELLERDGHTILILKSGGKNYELSMPE